MWQRITSVIAITLVLGSAPAARADDLREALVIKPGVQQLTVWELNKDGDNEQTYPVQFDTTIFSIPDNRTLALEDLKKDMRVRLTTQLRGDVHWLAKVEVLPDAPGRLQEGWVLRAGNGILVLRDRTNQNTITYQVAGDAKIMVDAREALLERLQPMSLARVTIAQRGPKLLVVNIEIRDENRR